MQSTKFTKRTRMKAPWKTTTKVLLATAWFMSITVIKITAYHYYFNPASSEQVNQERFERTQEVTQLAERVNSLEAALSAQSEQLQAYQSELQAIEAR